MGLDVIVAVNKLDLVNYEESTFDTIVEAFEDWAARIGLSRPLIIPIAAKPGDNVSAPSEKLSWWRGPTLLEALEAATPERAAQAALRLPVQRVLRARGDAAKPFRGYAGRIESGSLRVGDRLRTAGGHAEATVTQILTPQGEADAAPTGASISIVLDHEIDVSRGDVFVQSADAVETVTKTQAEICWLDTTPLQVGRRYLLKQGSRTTQAIVREVSYVRDLEGFAETAGDSVNANDIARVEVQTKDPILNDDYASFRGTGGFVLMDSATNQTVAAGVIRA
jgi:sulfate adenylyltransferase subunit 1